MRGLAADAGGQARYRVELRAARAGGANAGSGRVTWTEESSLGEVSHILADLAPLRVESGLHRLIMTVTDEVAGRTSRLERVVKFR